MDLKNLTSIEVLGLTIYGEARGEPIDGQVAVGSVIRNRVTAQKSTYLQVCLAPQQFSCWNVNDPNYPILIELAEKLYLGQMTGNIALMQALWVAEGIVSGALKDNTVNSRNYMTSTLFENHRPSWAVNARNLKVIGNHTFFNV